MPKLRGSCVTVLVPLSSEAGLAGRKIASSIGYFLSSGKGSNRSILRKRALTRAKLLSEDLRDVVLHG